MYSSFAHILTLTKAKSLLFFLHHREETLHSFRRNGYSTDLLFDFSIATDVKNSSFRAIYFDQALLGMSREYLVKGKGDEDVGHYFDFMQKVY